jgi:hypothetical protein
MSGETRDYENIGENVTCTNLYVSGDLTGPSVGGGGSTGPANALGFFGAAPPLAAPLGGDVKLVAGGLDPQGRPQIHDFRVNIANSRGSIWRNGSWEEDGDPTSQVGEGFVTYGANALGMGPDNTHGGYGFVTPYSFGRYEIVPGVNGGNTFLVCGFEDGSVNAPFGYNGFQVADDANSVLFIVSRDTAQPVVTMKNGTAGRNSLEISPFAGETGGFSLDFVAEFNGLVSYIEAARLHGFVLPESDSGNDGMGGILAPGAVGVANDVVIYGSAPYVFQPGVAGVTVTGLRARNLSNTGDIVQTMTSCFVNAGPGPVTFNSDDPGSLPGNQLLLVGGVPLVVPVRGVVEFVQATPFSDGGPGAFPTGGWLLKSKNF